jgi:hypothetical protein
VKKAEEEYRKSEAQRKKEAQDYIQQIATLQNTIDESKEKLTRLYTDIKVPNKIDLNYVYDLVTLFKKVSGSDKLIPSVVDTFLAVRPSAAYDIISHCAYYYNRLKVDEEKQILFNSALPVLLDYPDYIFDILNDAPLDLFNGYEKDIWERYNTYWIDKHGKAPNKLFMLCYYFIKYITDEHKNLLVKRVSARRMEDLANKIIELNFLEKEYNDKLEAGILMGRLVRAK